MLKKPFAVAAIAATVAIATLSTPASAGDPLLGALVGAGIGSLFGKTLVLSEEVHSAMISRGFTGDIRTLRRPAWKTADTLLVLAAALITALSMSWGHLAGAMR